MLWCRPASDGPRAFELLTSDTDHDEWVFKRDGTIRRPLEGIGGRSEAGIPYLVPEIVLLHKAKNDRAGDRHDLNVALAAMSSASRQWLRDAIRACHPGHVWIDQI